MSDSLGDAQSFDHEWPAVHERRINAFGSDADGKSDAAAKKKRPKELVGLALSGGGIRSAFYNLGFLQALSHRGLLRYVDYMCSVSGGGYIAGYLTSLAGKLQKDSKNFHADDASLQLTTQGAARGDKSNSENRAWHLGRHPSTGEIDGSLPGIGAYLTRTSAFVMAFLVSFVIRLLFYGGLMGVAATCVALFYRTFDDPMFRVLCDTVLDMGYGNELMKAFMPSVVVLLLYPFLRVLLAICVGLRRGLPAEWWPGGHSDELRHRAKEARDKGNIHEAHDRDKEAWWIDRLRTLQGCFLWVFTLSLLCGVAIFAGNDITNVRKHATGHWSLNNYAQWVILLAALSQVIAFLGRDRLFKSERNEKQRFPGLFQSVFTAGIVIFCFLAFVHMMGRENISDYTRHRDPHLVRGDVLSWRGLKELASVIAPGNFQSESTEKSPEVRDMSIMSPDLRLHSEWSQHTQGFFRDDELHRAQLASHPPSPFEVSSNAIPGVSFFWRMLLVPQAYFCSLSECFKSVPITSSDQVEFKISECWTPIPYVAATVREVWNSQERFLTPFNRCMESDQTFLALCQFVPDASPENGKYRNELSFEGKLSIDTTPRITFSQQSTGTTLTVDKLKNVRALHKWVKSSSDLLSDSDRKTLTAQIAVMTAKLEGPSESAGKEQSGDTKGIADRTRIVAANRILLERFLPGVIQPRHVASTNVVPPHDQAARRTWLIFWMACTVVGTFLGSSPRLVAAPRHFYRTQLNKHFLGWQGDRKLSDLRPEAAGLPLPIFLGTRMSRVHHRGRDYVECKPYRFTTTPKPECDSSSKTELASAKAKSDANQNAADQIGSDATFGDAVAFSGAAVTPLMTQNIWLSLLLDFFGTGLGGWPERRREPRVTNRTWMFVGWTIAGLIIVEAMIMGLIDPGVTINAAIGAGAIVAAWIAPGWILAGAANAALIFTITIFATWLVVGSIPADSVAAGWCVMACTFVGWIVAGWILAGWILVDPIKRVATICLIATAVAFASAMSLWAYSPAIAATFALVGFVTFLISLESENESFFKLLTPMLIRPTQIWEHEKSSTAEDDNHESPYVADGGFYDYLGVTELLRRRCELMVVSDAGAHLNQDSFATLAKMCETARSELGVQFLDLDHSAPIDFRRLRQDKTEPGLVHQTFLTIRVRYPEESKQDPAAPREGLLFYCQMGITDRDPVEILQIRNRFPSFPDEPTTNQFYTDEQVAAYRNLGYHIGNSLCSELHRWDDQCYSRYSKEGDRDISSSKSKSEQKLREFSEELRRSSLGAYSRSLQTNKAAQGNVTPEFSMPPGVHIVKQRLLTAYRLACHREEAFKSDEIHEEAIWPSDTYAFPTLRSEWRKAIRSMQNTARSQRELVGIWISRYESNADIRSAYRTAVLNDIHVMDNNVLSWCHKIAPELLRGLLQRPESSTDKEFDPFPEAHAFGDAVIAAHLSAIAIACHEVHSGRPSETFQVGGREKLVSLCISLSTTVSLRLLFDNAVPDQPRDQVGSSGNDTKVTPPVDRTSIDSRIAELLGEFLAMKREIFYRAECQTVTSFVYCLALNLVSATETQEEMIRRQHLSEAVRTVSFDTATQFSTERRLLSSQQKLLTALTRGCVDDLHAATKSVYCLAFLGLPKNKKQLAMDAHTRVHQWFTKKDPDEAKLPIW